MKKARRPARRGSTAWTTPRPARRRPQRSSSAAKDARTAAAKRMRSSKKCLPIRIASSRSPSGSSAATAGHTTSATADSTTSLPPAKTSTCSCSIPKSTPTRADRQVKSTPIGAVAKFASCGKRVKKKDLGMIAATYGYVYVAQCAMGADKAQLVKALKEAEAYHGPSLIICYAPCINHGIKMAKSQSEEKAAVDCGYWQLYRYNPELKEKGEESLHARLQGSHGRLPGIHSGRDALRFPQEDAARRCRGALQGDRRVLQGAPCRLQEDGRKRVTPFRNKKERNAALFCLLFFSLAHVLRRTCTRCIGRICPNCGKIPVSKSCSTVFFKLFASSALPSLIQTVRAVSLLCENFSPLS